jgi:hypothetical protein
MLPRQKYVRLSEGQILVRPEQKEYVDLFAKQHGISVNQLMRDVLQHAIDCPFFNGRSSTLGIVPPAEGSST